MTVSSTAATARSASEEPGAFLGGQVVRRLAQDDHAQDVVGGDLFAPDRSDQRAVVHDADPIREVEDIVDVVADEEDADAFRLQLLDELADLLGLRGPPRRRWARQLI